MDAVEFIKQFDDILHKQLTEPKDMSKRLVSKIAKLEKNIPSDIIKRLKFEKENENQIVETFNAYIDASFSKIYPSFENTMVHLGWEIEISQLEKTLSIVSSDTKKRILHDYYHLFAYHIFNNKSSYDKFAGFDRSMYHLRWGNIELFSNTPNYSQELHTLINNTFKSYDSIKSNAYGLGRLGTIWREMRLPEEITFAQRFVPRIDELKGKLRNLQKETAKIPTIITMETNYSREYFIGIIKTKK